MNVIIDSLEIDMSGRRTVTLYHFKWVECLVFSLFVMRVKPQLLLFVFRTHTHTHTYTNIHRHKSPFYSIRRLNILIGYCRQNIEHEPLEQEGVEEEE